MLVWEIINYKYWKGHFPLGGKKKKSDVCVESISIPKTSLYCDFNSLWWFPETLNF